MDGEAGGGGRAAQIGASDRRTKQAALDECRGMLYDRRQDYEGLVRTVGRMTDDAGARINALVVRSDDLRGVLGEWTPTGYRLETKKLGGKTVLRLEKHGAPPKSGAVRLRAAVAEIPGRPSHYCAVSDCSSADFKNVFMEFMSMYSPGISKTFLTNGELEGVFGHMEAQGYRTIIKYYSARRRRPKGGALESQVRSTSMPYGDFFKELSGDDAVAITVRYAAYAKAADARAARVSSRGTLARDSRFAAARGAGLLFTTIIPKALDLSLERNMRIEKSAESAGEQLSKPVVIKFAGKIFSKASMNKQYVDIIAKMPDASISKYHVNPHIHLSLVDYTDGSSYDLWVLTGDKLTIIPQIRVTGSSMKRLVNYIFENIGEGRVEQHGHGQEDANGKTACRD